MVGGNVGVAVWFFFIQSPFLFKLMGRKKFVPYMMAMTRLWIRVALVLNVVGLLLARSLFPVVGLLSTLINYMVVIPRALARGRASTKERTETESHSAVDFAVQGGSATQTGPMHRLVVALVLISTAANVAQLLLK